MAEYINEDKPMIIINETDSDFNVGVGVVFQKSGIYEISVNGKTTTVTKVSGHKTGKWIVVDDGCISGKCSVCGWEAHMYEDDVVGMDYCPNCGARLEGE